MDKKTIVICLLVIALIISWIYKIDNKEYIYIENPQIIKEYEYKDSILSVLDTIYLEKEINTQVYEQAVNNILSNTDSANLQFFSNYIEQYRLSIN